MERVDRGLERLEKYWSMRGRGAGDVRLDVPGFISRLLLEDTRGEEREREGGERGETDGEQWGKSGGGGKEEKETNCARVVARCIERRERGGRTIFACPFRDRLFLTSFQPRADETLSFLVAKNRSLVTDRR